ncbi:TPR-like protein [Choiromyces venosus 120613-1]|uniref:TPR-like protein n=1 Tax=Choiromyces venosus 120613-1 TaxID=1336337 RepID=A0A3N4JJN9_9PEZI|nr:TPR-like protein [Choiromyces venosus 120613-1]
MSRLVEEAAARHAAIPAQQPITPGAALPPAIAGVKNTTTEEFLKAMNKMPLFMTELDEANEDGTGENVQLEALKALAYEGEPHEVAQNFRTQGNDCYRAKAWRDAAEYYTKALTVKCGVAEIEEACYVNRAAANLELKNYRRVITDSKSALQLNPHNTKAWYRSARALLALDKLPESLQCIDNGLTTSPTNKPLIALQEQALSRQSHLASLESARQERLQRQHAIERTLAASLLARGITLRKTAHPPDMEDVQVHLENPLDPASELLFPAIFLYPLTSQSDFVKAFPLSLEVGEQLKVVLAEFPEWDHEKAYSPPSKVEVFTETKTGGLVKVGKKATLGSVIGGGGEKGKVEVVDGLVKFLIVPKGEVGVFLEDWKGRMGSK